MNKPHFTQEQLAQVAKLSDSDIKRVNENTEAILETHLFQQALQIQPTESLFIKATEFFKERRTLNPSDDTIQRLIQTQREKARRYILEKIYEEIAPPIKLAFDDLLIVGTESYSKLYQIKKVPQKPSSSQKETFNLRLRLNLSSNF